MAKTGLEDMPGTQALIDVISNLQKMVNTQTNLLLSLNNKILDLELRLKELEDDHGKNH